VCNVINKSLELELELEHEALRVLKELRKEVESLKSNTMVYKPILSAMEKDIDPHESSSYTRFIQRYMIGLRSSPYAHRANNLRHHRQVGKGAMESLERALEATLSLLSGDYYRATMNPSESKKPRGAQWLVLSILIAKYHPGHGHALISDLQDVTNEIVMCQQNNEHASKLVWYYYVTAQQWTGRRSPIDEIGNIQDRVACALDSVLGAFHVYPFAVSPKGFTPPTALTLAILNCIHETATRHEKSARRIGKAWVDDRVGRYYGQVRGLAALQTSLFELLWNGTIEQLRKHSAYSDDPERPVFERVVEKLDRALQIVHLKKQQFAIAFCGTVEADKSLFLNALMGRPILLSDGESVHSLMPTLHSVSLQSGFPQPGRAVFAMSKARQSLNYNLRPNHSSPR